jgi:hypothetical protein
MTWGIQSTARFRRLSGEDVTTGINVKAKNAVIALITKTKAFLALAPAKRAIRGTKRHETKGSSQTSHDEKSKTT